MDDDYLTTASVLIQATHERVILDRLKKVTGFVLEGEVEVEHPYQSFSAK